MGAPRKYEQEFVERAGRMYRDRLAEGRDSKVGARRHVEPRLPIRVRAVAVVRDGDRLLLQRLVCDPFWALPGGRVEHGELVADAVRRELAEEAGLSVVPQRLLAVVENRFHDGGRPQHSLEFYLAVRVDVDAAAVPTPREPDLEYAWFDLADAVDADVRPAGIVALVADRPGTAFLSAEALAAGEHQ